MKSFIQWLIKENNQEVDLLKPHELNDSQLQQLHQLVDQADEHPEYKGLNLVKGNDKYRLAIVNNQKVVGFLTPRKDFNYWRTGAIFVDSEYRRNGYAQKAIQKFFQNPNYRPAKAWISNNNLSSQKAFTKAGFKIGNRRDLSDNDNDKGHDYYLT
jgi:RimJ/RimL family protein N-acetyltransferase